MKVIVDFTFLSEILFFLIGDVDYDLGGRRNACHTKRNL
jgi:hypothetical protein